MIIFCTFAHGFYESIMKTDRKSFGIITAALLGLLAIIAVCLFAPINKTGGTAYLYIDEDDTVDSVETKLSDIARGYGVSAVSALASCTGYADNIHTGRYELGTGTGALMLFRHINSGQQSPVRLTIPSVRTMDRLAEELSEKLMMDGGELMKYFASNDSCAKYGKDTATIACLFIPNTYEVYWNISADRLLAKMQKESDAFWNTERMGKAKGLGLTSDEVITIASIIDEETANNAEKPMIAGMYYNRYEQGMLLQADPTVKFALKDFEIKRIYNNMLDVQSPYNTYRNVGLPPGPIRIPSVAGIDAVLNLVRHDYLYMCAKEDFSGTHNFAKTYQEHLQNAAKYTKALNARGIK